MTNVDKEIANHCNEIKALPYAKYIVSEDVIERNFGYKIIRQQVSAGKNSLVYKCETAKRPDVYCLIKAYKLGKDKIRYSLREETCQIMRYVSGKCPQIISTFDLFYTNEKIYLMCDWSAKGEVLVNMKQPGVVRLNEKMLRDWAIDLLSAVNFLHSNAICHRNIAPNCLLLTNDMRVKIGTLGDAVVYCKPEGTLIRQKWPKFSRSSNWNQPPEVAKGKLYDPRRADIWSVGATLFWFITRGHPINYASKAKLPKLLEQKLEYLPKVSKQCHAFVKKMLTYQPASRPTIAAALQLEWVSSTSKASPTTGVAKEPTVEIGITEKGPEDPGEAAGPEETHAEVQDSTSKKSGGHQAEMSDKPAQAEDSTPPPE